MATAEQKEKLIKVFSFEGTDAVQRACGYFIEVGAIMPTEGLAELPLRYVPVTAGELRELGALIAELADTGKADKPSWITQSGRSDTSAAGATTTHNKGDALPDRGAPAIPVPEGDWHSFPMPWGKQAGVPLGELEKPYLFGLWANYTVETEFKGKPKKAETIAKDTEFRAMLDLAGEHYQFTKD
jgi:hypothetical protein